MKSVIRFLIILSFCSILAACSSSQSSYTDATAVDTSTVGFSSTDLQTTAQTMTDNMLTFPAIVKLTSNGNQPILFVDTINNQTDQHINTTNVTNMIMTELTQSGKFLFTDPSVVQQVRQQLSYQQDSGLVQKDSAIKIGQQVGARYMLYGSISNIKTRNSSVTDNYMLITMKLLDLKTGYIIWADQKQIRKTQTRATFGW